MLEYTGMLDELTFLLIPIRIFVPFERGQITDRLQRRR